MPSSGSPQLPHANDNMNSDMNPSGNTLPIVVSGHRSPRYGAHHPPVPQYYIYQWVDACDSNLHKWIEAQVVQLDPVAQQVRVHFKGYESKWDETISLGEGRLAPLHTHTPKGIQYQMQYCKGMQLDVCDSVDVWRLARVLDLSPSRLQVYVTYLDFPSKYDEWINIDSYRLAPLHTHTRPKPPKQKQTILTSQTNEEQYRIAMQRRGFMIVDMDPDGNCLFRSISHQVYGTQDQHQLVRDKCMEYVAAHAPFFENYIDEDFKQYVARMKFQGEWGGEIEIRAMGELYGRPVEIYVYGTQPRTVYRGTNPSAYPIRLSYHWNSHYMSIINPDHFKSRQFFLSSPPGEHEDERIRWSCSIMGPERGQESPEDAAMRAALAASRADFENRDLNEIYSRLFLSDLEEAKRQSESGMIEQAILRSLQSETQLTSDESNDMQRALNESLRDAPFANIPMDDLQRAQLLSMHEFEQKNAASGSVAIQTCVDMGFERSKAEAAYTLFANDSLDLNTLTNSMISYLSTEMGYS